MNTNIERIVEIVKSTKPIEYLVSGLIFLCCFFVIGCASGPQFKIIEKPVSETGITAQGEFIEIKTISVLAQRDMLQQSLDQTKREKEVLNEQLSTIHTLLVEARVRLGLPANSPKAKVECCTPEGNLKSFIPALTMAEELAKLDN